MKKPTIISLCPGTGVGEYGSSKYFQTVLAIDIEKKFLASFEANHPGVTTLCADIANPETIVDAKKMVPTVGGIVASTPCNDFATCKSGSKAEKAGSQLSCLFLDAIEWVRAYQPTFYIAENVEPVRRSWQFGAATARLEQLGYVWRLWVLDAADFGVPQHRQRAFLIAIKKGLNVPACPEPIYGDVDQRKKNSKLLPYQTLKNCIYDLFERELHAIQNGEQAHAKFLTEDMLGIAKLSAIRAWYLVDIPPGGNWKNLPPAKMRVLLDKLKANEKEPFAGLAARYAWVSTPGALRTGPSVLKCSMPVHPGIDSADAIALQKAGFWMRRPSWPQPSGALSSNPHGDKSCLINPGYRVDFDAKHTATMPSPIITRYLTVREYARIMGLPDSFVPIGSIATKYRMIGNGIPPKLMEAVCRAVAKVLPTPKESTPKGKSMAIKLQSQPQPNGERSSIKIKCGDALKVLKTMPSDSVNCIVTSPPYWNLRDYLLD